AAWLPAELRGHRGEIGLGGGFPVWRRHQLAGADRRGLPRVGDRALPRALHLVLPSIVSRGLPRAGRTGSTGVHSGSPSLAACRLDQSVSYHGFGRAELVSAGGTPASRAA